MKQELTHTYLTDCFLPFRKLARTCCFLPHPPSLENQIAITKNSESKSKSEKKAIGFQTPNPFRLFPFSLLFPLALPPHPSPLMGSHMFIGFGPPRRDQVSRFSSLWELANGRWQLGRWLFGFGVEAPGVSGQSVVEERSAQRSFHVTD